MTRQKQLLGFRIEVLPEDKKAAETVKELLRKYGIKNLRTTAGGSIRGKISKLDADTVFNDAKKMMRKAKGGILDLEVSPLYSD